MKDSFLNIVRAGFYYGILALLASAVGFGLVTYRWVFQKYSFNAKLDDYYYVVLVQNWINFFNLLCAFSGIIVSVVILNVTRPILQMLQAVKMDLQGPQMMMEKLGSITHLLIGCFLSTCFVVISGMLYFVRVLELSNVEAERAKRWRRRPNGSIDYSETY